MGKFQKANLKIQNSYCSTALLLYRSSALLLYCSFHFSRFTLHGFTLHAKKSPLPLFKNRNSAKI
jgi:hypothetical protein